MIFFFSLDSAFRNFGNFWGRSGRAEFWLWMLFGFCLLWTMSFSVALVEGFGALDMSAAAFGRAFTEKTGGLETPLKIFLLAFSAVTFLPSLALSVRRLHDTGRSGAWILIQLVPVVGAFVLLYFFVMPGDPEPNRYGPPPPPGIAT
ncbi:MAG: DUF805 domain-containing protein [Kiloniellales bacterium]|nr:DUF805 domain-containing protein [Kiloniellales bacterium]